MSILAALLSLGLQDVPAEAPSSAILPAGQAVAVVECIRGPRGRPQDCRVISETHERQGFGEAALRIVQNRRVAAHGARVESDNRFRVAIRFQLDGDQPRQRRNRSGRGS
ncbi:MAG: energy transducer TonB [Brevundimonas sp.]|uniref:energy transducer TonB n=1 Tax=Brevundimonas sp. TaxID=1871086 RepID=UPI00391D4C3A